MSYNGVYLSAYYPDKKNWEKCLDVVFASDFDFFEIGIPFSDPLADGPVIWKASQQVLAQTYFEIDMLLEDIKKRRKNMPCYVMTYANLLFSYGLQEFSQRYKSLLAGVIVPDLPLVMHQFFYDRGFRLPLVPFATPASRDQDLRLLNSSKTDFVYLISTFGITGSKVDFNNQQLKDTVKKVRQYAPTANIVIGFGVRDSEDVAQILKIADGFIVGSQAVKRQQEPLKLGNYLEQLLTQ